VGHIDYLGFAMHGRSCGGTAPLRRARRAMRHFGSLLTGAIFVDLQVELRVRVIG